MFPSAAWFFILQGKEILPCIFDRFQECCLLLCLVHKSMHAFHGSSFKTSGFCNLFFCCCCLNLYTFHFATCSPIPLCDWYQDRGLGVSLQEHLYMCVYMYAHMYMCVYAYIYLFENSRFLPDRKCSVKQIILFWGSPAI